MAPKQFLKSIFSSWAKRSKLAYFPKQYKHLTNKDLNKDLKHALCVRPLEKHENTVNTLICCTISRISFANQHLSEFYSPNCLLVAQLWRK